MSKSTMPKRATGVYRRADSSIWQWKIKAPTDLSYRFPSGWAHRCSLGTSDLKEANLKATSLRAQWLERFELERRDAVPVDTLTPEHGRAIAREALRVLLADEKWRLNKSARRGWLLPLQALGIIGMDGYARRLGWSLDESTPGAQEAFEHYLQTLRTALQADLAEVPPAEAAPEKVRRLRDVFDKWREAQGPSLSPDTIRARERALTLFEQAMGNPPLESITRAMGNDFSAWLQKQDGARKTAHDRFTYVKSLLIYGAQELEVIPRNPWTGIDIPYTTESRRRPWTAQQIASFFGQALFTAYALPKAAKRAGADAAYWIPVLGLFTGARVGELCQLRVADIVHVQGIWCIDINEDEDGKSLKTDASRRKVPIHSKLIELGFLDYVTATREAGHASLWPLLHLHPEKPSLGFSRWFNETPRHAVAGVDIPDFHSLRHTVRSTMSAAEVPEPDQDNITGHTVKGSTGTQVYRHVSMAKLQAAVERIHYPTFQLARSFPAALEPRARRPKSQQAC